MIIMNMWDRYWQLWQWAASVGSKQSEMSPGRSDKYCGGGWEGDWITLTIPLLQEINAMLFRKLIALTIHHYIFCVCLPCMLFLRANIVAWGCESKRYSPFYKISDPILVKWLKMQMLHCWNFRLPQERFCLFAAWCLWQHFMIWIPEQALVSQISLFNQCKSS